MMRNTLHISASLLVSSIFWLAIVSSEQNIQSFEQGIPVQFLNIPDGLFIEGETPRVEIKIDTAKELNKKITTENFKAFLDLSTTSIGEKTLPIQVKSQDPSIRIVSYTPHTLNIKLEKVEEKTLSTEIKFQGNISNNYSVSSSRLKNSSALVRAGSTTLNKVASIRAMVSLQGEEGNILKNVPLQAFDRLGNALPSVQITPSETEVEVLLTQIRDSKIVGIKVPVEGSLKASNLYIKSLMIRPNVTEIRAKKSILDTVQYVETKAVDLSSITSSKSFSLKLIPPLGADITGEKQVSVEIILESLQTPTQETPEKIEAPAQ